MFTALTGAETQKERQCQSGMMGGGQLSPILQVVMLISSIRIGVTTPVTQLTHPVTLRPTFLTWHLHHFCNCLNLLVIIYLLIYLFSLLNIFLTYIRSIVNVFFIYFPF